MYSDYEKMIPEIKSYGRLIALESAQGGCCGKQYWMYKGVIYAVSSAGNNYCIWCSLERMAQHLHRLYIITGKKHFTDNGNIAIIDKHFINNFIYA